MYRYHPEIDGLKCNEDGSEIIYMGERLKARDYNIKSRQNNDAHYIIINRKVIQIGRIIAECWLGLPENPRFCAIRKDKNKGYHYSNLMWGKCGFNPQRRSAKRDGKSKIGKEDIPKIEARIKAGETLRSIAADYKTSDMSISRIKKRMK